MDVYGLQAKIVEARQSMERATALRSGRNLLLIERQLGDIERAVVALAQVQFQLLSEVAILRSRG